MTDNMPKRKTSKLRRILSFLLISALLAPDMAAFAYAVSISHGKHEGELHYCEISKGPCRHGDACPIDHGQNKAHADHKEHKMAHEEGYDMDNKMTHSDDSQKDDSPITKVAEACHTDSKHPAASINRIDHPYMITQFSQDGKSQLKSKMASGSCHYIQPFMALPDKPPSISS